ncbi:NmrA family protein [Hypoxylon trugodes]|uniref:NmrA family protein n=1 Tax=Hypoxylon trugodes TaxID=326681 RepID=UPI00219E26F8|nr:NmrA family protein [Hypoxylon trugodes]KAI1386132.1 NmrA family protein [Hypoxylon trugodes]
MTTVFVTSATGSQGSALCNELRNLGWNVRATTRDLNSPVAQSLLSAGVHLTLGNWDDEDSLRKGLEGSNKLFLCLLPSLTDFDQAPRRAALIARVAREVGVNHVVSSTTLGSFLVEPGFVPSIRLGPFFDAHVRSKKRVEQAAIDGGFAHWTVLRPGFFMANFVEPKIQFGYIETKEGSWTNSLTAESPLGLVDHLDIARFAVAAFQDPTTYHGRKLGVISEELQVQDAMDQLADAIGDGRSIKAIFMTDEEIAREQAKGSWLFFSSEPCLRHLSGYTDLDELQRLVPGLMTFKDFLIREKEAVRVTYLSLIDVHPTPL